MSEIVYENYKYKDLDIGAQKVLQASNIYSFRYFPETRMWMASDVTVEHFRINKFYHVDSPISGPDIICEQDKGKDIAQYQKIASGEVETSSTELRGVDGHFYRIILSALEKDENGKVTIISGLIEDVDELKRASILVKTLADDYDCVYFVDFVENYFYPVRLSSIISSKYREKFTQNPTYESAISLYTENEVIDEEKDEFIQITSRDNLNRMFMVKNIFMHDFRIMRDGAPRYIRMKAVNQSAGDQLTQMIIAFASVDLDIQREKDREIYFDQITLGCNYTYYTEMLKSAVDPGYIVSMDIRAFKVVNDVCGISAGDKTLQKVSCVVEKAVGEKGFYGHVNADHFVFYLDVESDEEVISVLEEIKTTIEAIVEEEHLPKISAYFGVTKWEPGDRIQVMFSEANTAKHRIKNSKDEFYGFYREEDNKIAIEEKRIEDAFEGAIKDKELIVWYQPKFTTDKKLVGAEALIRWKKKDGKMIFPDKFIPIFEKNGMIKALDEYVFTTVCERQKIWIEKYGKTIPISINLSRASLYYDNIVEKYSAIADEVGLDTSLVPIEITESAAVSNSDIKSIADKFFSSGFLLHMDDFGTGYSSLATLNLLKIDTLKLDKSLIDYIGEFGGDRLIKHTVALAKDLGMKVTAEGVENGEQVEFLKSVECDSIQGYYFAKPMPLDDFEELLDSCD